jgi:hypothetical protein
VLEEVRKAGASRNLVLGADVIPDIDSDDRTVAVLVHQHVQTVVKCAMGERNIHQ